MRENRTSGSVPGAPGNRRPYGGGRSAGRNRCRNHLSIGSRRHKVRAVSAISCWEIAWLVRRGRLRLDLDLKDWMDEALTGSGVSCIAVDRSIAECAAGLFEHHRDPADRLIIATAIVRDLCLISLDGHFSAYDELSGRLIRPDGSIASGSRDQDSDEF